MAIQQLQMTFREWMAFQLRPEELIINASAIDGSDFHQQHPIGIAVFAVPALPMQMGECKFEATQENLCSAMFQPGTTRRRHQHRADRVEELSQLGFVDPICCSVHDHRIDAKTYIRQLLRDKFTCSPRGHGVDCHRNYEAILCKCIPLITGADESMRIKYHGLPVIFMEDYKKLSVDWLNQKYEEMQDVVYNFAPMTRSYWYTKRPDVDIDMQSEKWLKKFKRWDKWKHYVQCKPRPAQL